MRFNPKLAALAFATTAALASFGAQAQTVDVKVIGTITPGACTPDLAGGGTIDYGRIDRSIVQQADFASLPKRELAFTITCDVPTRVGLKPVDNKASTLVPSALAKLGSSYIDVYAYGLGSAAGKKLGAYVLGMVASSFTADANGAMRNISSSNNGTSWAVDNNMRASGATVSWANATSLTPFAFEKLSGKLSVQAVLNKGSELDLTDDVALDGSATLELVYL